MSGLPQRLLCLPSRSSQSFEEPIILDEWVLVVPNCTLLRLPDGLGASHSNPIPSRHWGERLPNIHLMRFVIYAELHTCDTKYYADHLVTYSGKGWPGVSPGCTPLLRWWGMSRALVRLHELASGTRNNGRKWTIQTENFRMKTGSENIGECLVSFFVRMFWMNSVLREEFVAVVS